MIGHPPVRSVDPRAVCLAAIAAGALSAAAVSPLSAAPPQWRPVSTTADLIPGTEIAFNSFNPPSVNLDGTVVFRARSRGPQQPIRGLFLRRAGGAIEEIARVGSVVPDPNNTEYPPGSGQLAPFREFPSFPRIDAASDAIASRGQSQPVWTYLAGDGKESRVGTAGVYALVGGTLQSGATALGAVTDAATGELVFPHFAVPGAPEGTRFMQFPGAASITDGDTVVFKGNWIDPLTKEGFTGVYYRRVDAATPDAPIERVAVSGTLIPGQGAAGSLVFGSTSPPSAADGRLVFLGLDDEDDPTFGAIYLADLVPDPPLVAVASIGGQVPGEPKGVGFTRLGEALAFDGRFVAFWGAWGEAWREIVLTCPSDGNADLIAYCLEEFPDGFTTEVPVEQGIFVYDSMLGRTYVVSKTNRPDGGPEFVDYLYWNFSGRVPGTGGGGGGGGGHGDEGGLAHEGDEEFARWRSSAFVAASGSGGATVRVAFTGRSLYSAAGADTAVDSIMLWRGPGRGGVMTMTQTGGKGAVIDPDAPGDPVVTAVGLEREGLRGPHLAISVSMEDPSLKEATAGIYSADIADAIPCPVDLDGDGRVDGRDLTILLADWGPCPGCIADFTGDGEVGGADLAILLSSWGVCE